MSLADAECDAGAVEQCIDELNNCLTRLAGHAPIPLAVALRVHLEALLQSLLEGELCTREEVRDFLRELQREALQHDEK